MRVHGQSKIQYSQEYILVIFIYDLKCVLSAIQCRILREYIESNVLCYHTYLFTYSGPVWGLNFGIIEYQKNYKVKTDIYFMILF